MYEIRTTIDIDASAERVWDVLTDFASYPAWNPFVRSIEGDVARGERVKVTLQQPGSKPLTVAPTIISFEEGRRFAWLGRLGLPKIFDGEHWYAIEPLAAQQVRFEQGERFGGVLVPFLRKMLDTKTRQGFQAMNRALKERAEG